MLNPTFDPFAATAAPRPTTPDTLPGRLAEGREAPLGASVSGEGVNFAVFSENATRVELCVFDASGEQELRRYALHGPHDGIWHGLLPGAGAGLVYGLRAHGPWSPERGHRFNPNKLLLDPCAREIVGRFEWRTELFERGPDEGPDRRDNAAVALKARVTAPWTQPLRHARPRHAARDLVIQELHVKGFTMQMPDIPPGLRGSYAALAHPAAIAHWQRLGINAIELLPVQLHVDEAFLAPKGLVNHWGYNTLGFFCVDPRFSTTPHDAAAATAEFRAMVDALHGAGIEVLLDVVYNHTAEADERGPTLSFRGLDHAVWYRLDEQGRCLNHTGCGNTLNAGHPRVMQFVLDSLRWWVQAMGVDGFRFDLAPVLGRIGSHFDTRAPFFTALMQDPVLAEVRLIAESWDMGPDGYQVGRFPGRWQEWNDRFRDSVRGWWLGRGVSRGEFARRFAASNDLFHHSQRQPTASVNFVTAHDGFTLADLTSYSQKHNQANGENNRDGRADETCANAGVDGPATDPKVTALRLRWRRALMATLLLAQGTPMLSAGDERLNSQLGNNNAWNQDNPTGWLDWSTEAEAMAFEAFVAQLLALRRAEPALRHAQWFESATADPLQPVMRWASPDGRELTAAEWQDPQPQPLACRIDAAENLPMPGSRALYLVFNPTAHACRFVLPTRGSEPWRVALDSTGEHATGRPLHDWGITAGAHALIVLHVPRHAAAALA